MCQLNLTKEQVWTKACVFELGDASESLTAGAVWGELHNSQGQTVHRRSGSWEQIELSAGRYTFRGNPNRAGNAGSRAQIK